VLKLRTPLLVILGHVRCGAIKAAISDYRDEDSWPIREKLDRLQLPLRALAAEPDQDAAWRRGVELNVDYQVSLALKRYAARIESGDLTVAGFVYDFADEYGRGRGRAILRNLNGETNPEKLTAFMAMDGGEESNASH